MKRQQPEADFQKSLCQFLDLYRTPNGKRLDYFHVPNGGMFPVQYRVKLKKIGLKSGVPDLLIITNCEQASNKTYSGYIHYNGIALELKAGKNKTSPEQDKWHEIFRQHGWLVAVVYSIEDVQKLFKEVRFV